MPTLGRARLADVTETPGSAEVAQTRPAALARIALMLLPGALIVYMGFNAGGYFPATPAVAAVVLAQILLVRIIRSPHPFEGLALATLVAIAALALYALLTLLSALWSAVRRLVSGPGARCARRRGSAPTQRGRADREPRNGGHTRGSQLDYDLVVIDTPPLLAVSDAFPLLRKVDGVIIVGRVGHNRRDVAERLHRTLAGVHAPLSGGHRERLQGPTCDVQV